MTSIPIPPLLPGSLKLTSIEVDKVRLSEVLNSVNTWKKTIRLATTVNITLSGNQLIDGVMTSQSDRIVVKNQTNGIENGIYEASSGTWTRSQDLPLGSSVSGTVVFISEGTNNLNSLWVCTTTSPNDIAGINSLTFSMITLGGGTPGGADTEVQYNNSGSFAGSSNFTWDSGTNTLTAPTISLTNIFSNTFNFIWPTDTPSTSEYLCVNGVAGSDVTLEWGAISGGSPGAPTNSIQYNNAGSFAGSANYLFDGSNTITLNNTLQNLAGNGLIVQTQDEGTPQTITLNTGSSTTATNSGAALNITAGNGNTTGAGGVVNITGGNGGTSGNGGFVGLFGGSSGATGGDGGDVGMIAGAGVAGNGGGNIFVTGNSSAGDGGDFTVNTGNGTVNGGTFGIQCGSGSIEGGECVLRSGNGGITGTGGDITFTCGNGGSTSGDGGDLNLTSGDGTGGGDINLTPGTSSTGNNGLISFLGNTIHQKATVTQTTSSTTPVTINATAGSITTVSFSLSISEGVTFTVNNSYVTATSAILITTNAGVAGGIAPQIPAASIQNIGNGTFDITMVNDGTVSATGPKTFAFLVL